MSNEQLAREWAEKYLRYADESDSTELYAAAQIVKANTTPQTMADVKWYDEKHYLAGATSEIDNSECVMLLPRNGMIVNAKPGNDRASLTSPGALTPNGKRYKLVEVTKPDHPTTLTTVEDYKDAPDGTIIATPGWHTVPLVKRDGAWHRDRLTFASMEIADGLPIEVLRWGWGE